jgi:hypothetical protein
MAGAWHLGEADKRCQFRDTAANDRGACLGDQPARFVSP